MSELRYLPLPHDMPELPHLPRRTAPLAVVNTAAFGRTRRRDPFNVKPWLCAILWMQAATLGSVWGGFSFFAAKLGAAAAQQQQQARPVPAGPPRPRLRLIQAGY